MPNLTTLELKAFLPAKDFELSKRFYQELGFSTELLGEDLVCFCHGPSKFLLQRYYSREFAESLQMHLLVEDVDSWWEQANRIITKYGSSPDIPRTQPWGLRDFTFLDPSGVLWRVAQEID